MSKGFKITSVIILILGTTVLALENLYNNELSGISILDLLYFIVPLAISIFLILYIKTKKDLFLWISMIPVVLLIVGFIISLYFISQIRG